jgi:hypothetical protein
MVREYLWLGGTTAASGTTEFLLRKKRIAS